MRCTNAIYSEVNRISRKHTYGIVCVCMYVFTHTHMLNRMGKTRDLFKEIRDTKGKFHAKMSTIKDRNDMDLREAEDIKKRWQEYTENYTKKIFTTQIITMV